MSSPLIRFGSLITTLLAIGLLATHHTAEPAGAGVPDISFANSSSSPDDLVGRFVTALAANDRAAIERLRVDEREYRDVIMPGSVKPGRPPQIMPDRKSEYFWRHHNTLSVYSLDGVLKGYGGGSLRLRRVEYLRVEPFAWYTAYRDPILQLETATGEVVSLQLGSIAEYRGRYKFISYRAD